MPAELDQRIQDEAEKHDMKYSVYVRTVLQNSTQTPFAHSDVTLTVDDSDVEEAQRGAT
jgi:hypothetical protein